MKPQPDQSLKEVLAGLVERVTYHNAEIAQRKHGRSNFARALLASPLAELSGTTIRGILELRRGCASENCPLGIKAEEDW